MVVSQKGLQNHPVFLGLFVNQWLRMGRPFCELEDGVWISRSLGRLCLARVLWRILTHTQRCGQRCRLWLLSPKLGEFDSRKIHFPAAEVKVKSQNYDYNFISWNITIKLGKFCLILITTMIKNPSCHLLAIYIYLEPFLAQTFLPASANSQCAAEGLARRMRFILWWWYCGWLRKPDLVGGLSPFTVIPLLTM